MIKNWKLFLESQDNEGEFKNVEDLKNSLKLIISPLLVSEALIRLSGDKVTLSNSVDLITKLFIKSFTIVINERDIEDERKEFFINIFTESIENSKETFINISFLSGIEKMVDIFIGKLEEFKKKSELELEDWKKEKELDYSEMSNKELNELIDDALDKRDFDRVKILSSYLKESVSVDSNKILEDVCYDICELFIKYIYKYI
jgi:histidyl-tRNA synthetase